MELPNEPPRRGSSSPGLLSDIDDGGSDSSASSSDFEPRQAARGNDEAGPLPEHALGGPYPNQFHPGALDASLASQWGSWYFHQSQSTGLGSAYSAYTPQTLPPHLAYWMHNPHVSDLSGGGNGSRPLSPMSPSGEGMAGKGPTPAFVPHDDEYKVYSSRWIMLAYMSLLNLLSDWTCYSVAPIAMLTQEAFGDVDPESLVTVFLGANAVASAMEPAILGRLGLRRTVLFGGFLLMMGSIVKSGGLRSVVMGGNAAAVGGGSAEEALLEELEASGNETWRLYLGFFLVGLSQPLYQCTPALLSASWFPENERTMATGVALNSNQLGIGCAFVFGTMLVSTQEDIIPYFGLLSIISTVTFIGAALQFDDAPPTPPSDTARVIRGDLEIKIPFIGTLGRRRGQEAEEEEANGEEELRGEAVAAPAPASMDEPVGTTISEDARASAAVVEAPSPAPTDEPVGRPDGDDDDEGTGGASNLQAQPGHPLLGSPGAAPMAYPPYPGYYPPVSPGIPPPFHHGYDSYGHYHNDLLARGSYYYQKDDFGGFSDDEIEGAEPIMTQMDHRLDVDVRDDQLVQQFKACFRRPGFAHCVVAFTTSGIIVNTLSTFMDYLVTLNGAPRVYVGIVGGTFQALIMCASLVFGGWTDHSRKYYFVILAMLIFGAFALAVCNVDLDADAGGDLRLTLLVVAVLAGPLQPISTELGVEVVYPLSENTVLVIQQLFSNLLSAAFIPVFKALRDVGTGRGLDDATLDAMRADGMKEVPQYTFSFYMLIVIHALSTCYFATFNGTYLRYEAEEEKKAKKEERRRLLAGGQNGGYGSAER